MKHFQADQKKILFKQLPSGALPSFDEVSSPALLKTLYALRGYESDKIAAYELSELFAPDDMLGINEAADFIAKAIQSQKRILIVGDFDADGATSTALGVRALFQMGASHVDFLVPNRFEYGYGLTPEIVAVAAERSPDLIITVDNGISSIDGVDAANKMGIDVIVTDHHLPADSLPKARAIVNPNQEGCAFKSKNLAGVGVIFYLMCVLRTKLQALGWFESQGLSLPNMSVYLDLVALGTVADVVPLDFNNRILVSKGLARIRAGRCIPGITALFHVAGKDAALAVSQDLGFVAGPRLNAAGRLDDMAVGIKLLLEDDSVHAITQAAELDGLNKERRQIEASMQKEAEVLLAKLDEVRANSADAVATEKQSNGVCLYQADWHQGVIGILASRVKEKLHRPTIIFAESSDTEIKGSGRSVEGVHLRDVLDIIAKTHPGMLNKFGGHAMAAGLTLAKSDFMRFREAFSHAVEVFLGGEKITPTIKVDGELPAKLLTLEVANAIKEGGPWGQGFIEPLFCNEFFIVSQKIVGANHLKCVLAPFDDSSVVIDAIAFNVDTTIWPAKNTNKVKMVYCLDVNTFRGRSNPQLRAVTMEPIVG